MDNFPILKGKIEIDEKKEEEKRDFEKKIFILILAIYEEEKDYKKNPIRSYDFGDEINKWIEAKIGSYEISDKGFKLCKKVIAHTNRCPHAYYKTFCHKCPTKCYKKEDLARIRPIMAYSGKKLFKKHPLISMKFMKKMVNSLRIIKKYEKA